MYGPWASAYMVGILLSGLIWGGSLYVLGRSLPFETNAFLAFVLAGVAAGIVPTRSPRAFA